MQVPILKMNDVLIVTLGNGITDDEAIAIKHNILVKIKETECQGLLIDISVVDLIDSFMGRILNEIAEMAKLMGSRTAITGMSPQVAITMIELGLKFQGVYTALTVEKGFEWLRNPNTGA
ncbi:rsbT antagonist protein RsbS [Tumebacillus sp. BK434]|uniref:STAS domain-containing protein n=1 Tax=Tumebacillus sp. BK434 TaxID=2512169 RepID=UPI001051469F|nr:STAS domain-containing protein [Tumebacillus sp. BK434]TCP55575.1 rsbT antagonist protein RsbS [Tumebacillus sp. BK434]